MRKHIDTFKNFCLNEDFRPGFVTSPAPWGSVEEARKIIIGVLLQRPDLTLQKFVELNKKSVARYHEEGQKIFYDAVERLNIPFWNKVRG